MEEQTETTQENNKMIEAPNETQNQFDKDNGIFDFMTPDRAIELYKEIISNGIPKLDWKFYGRRKPGELVQENNIEEAGDLKETNQNNETQGDNNNLMDDFDFDEEFGDITAPLSDSLRLKKRPGQDSDRKTNLSDIMSDIMKESHTETILDSTSLIKDQIENSTMNHNGHDTSVMLVDIQEDDKTEFDDLQGIADFEEYIEEQHQAPVGKEEDQTVNQVVSEIQTELMRELETTAQVVP